MFGASSEPASVMEFGLYATSAATVCNNNPLNGPHPRRPGWTGTRKKHSLSHFHLRVYYAISL